jgi:hypothetical protein
MIQKCNRNRVNIGQCSTHMFRSIQPVTEVIFPSSGRIRILFWIEPTVPQVQNTCLVLAQWHTGET